MLRSIAIPRGQPASEYSNIGDRKIETLSARGRHDVCCIPSQKQTAILHRLGHETPHRRYAFLIDASTIQLKTFASLKASI